MEWREPTPTRPPYGETFRSCSYCGSVHPADLLELLDKGAQLGGSDWKYGWPHKFYISYIPNPLAGQVVEMGSRSTCQQDGTRVTEPIMSPAPQFSHAKWYNDHLMDDGFDDEAREKLFAALKLHANIEFTFEDGKLGYRAPHAGYQK